MNVSTISVDNTFANVTIPKISLNMIKTGIALMQFTDNSFSLEIIES